jgi:hypothetical protein
MADRIGNAVDWATKQNKDCLKEDLRKLQESVDELPPLIPEMSVAGSGLDSQATGE